MLTRAQWDWLDHLSALYEPYEDGTGPRPVAEVAAPIVARVTRQGRLGSLAATRLTRRDRPYGRVVEPRPRPVRRAG